jgi:hypothetical protein
MRSKSLAIMMMVFLACTASASAEDGKATVKCKMNFTLKGWSLFYKTAQGKGMVKCSNGQSANVKLNAKGGGLTAGKSSIDDGVGEFSAVKSIDELFGSYASAEAHAGAVKSAQGQVMTKGEVSLAWGGTGRGWDLGIALGKLTISR